MPSGEAAIAAVCSSRYICSGYSAGDGRCGGARRQRGGDGMRAWDCYSRVCELCMSDARTSRRSFCHSLALNVAGAAQCCRAALYAPCLARRLSEPTDKAAAMREREFFAKKTALLGRQASRPGWFGRPGVRIFGHSLQQQQPTL